ncbi:ThiF family adenylyltransferase [Amycolatopsis aidingensis]|uniref:ThiF family adenylyltransferase n=1 Tax=Amycolatopsis aidingensis TaxID=2842453 RepID=UPI001C0DAE19|nr:ThiF family adenylyltransferase [Amycolatopsis aidingensis]
MRPRIKAEHCPARFGDGWLRIGGKVFGIAADLRDPDGAVWALLELLDGTRTVDQVIADLVHRFPGRAAGEIRADIEQLSELGYVEDADEPACTALSSRQRERYERGRLLNRWVDRTPRGSSWDFQIRLSRARVVVVGLGGVGCTAALALAQSGVGRLHCVDHDVVELSNLNRQVLYGERDLGQPKAEVAVAKLRAVNSDIEVTGEPTRIEHPAALRSLAAACDVLVMSADQPAELWSWANRACARTRTAWVHGAYRGPQADMGLYRPGAGPCYECARAADQDRAALRPPVAEWRAVPMGPRVHAANAVTAGMVGNLVAHAVLSLLTGSPRLRVNCQYGFNLVTLDHNFVTVLDRSHPECRTCAVAS